jgi:tRNA modification GTPase
MLDCLIDGQRLLKEGHLEEIYAEEIRKTIPLIGQLTGEIRMDDIIEDIFSRFCVGK